MGGLTPEGLGDKNRDASIAAKLHPTIHSHTIEIKLHPSKPTFVLLSNPYSSGTNTLAKVLPVLPPGTIFFKLVAGSYALATFDDLADGSGWTVPDLSVPPGEGFFLQFPPSNNPTFSLTFEGQLPTITSEVSHALPPMGQWVILGSQLSIRTPQRLSTDLNFPAQPGDMVYQFINGVWRISTYDEIDLVWYPQEPVVDIAAGIYLVRAVSNPTQWIEQTQRPNIPPVADAGPDQILPAPGTVMLSAAGSTDADGSITSAFWKFGDGTTSTGLNVSHLFTKEGQYLVELTVTDDEGATAVDTASVTVAAGLERFVIGEPTGEEQHYLELINRARANPVGEAARMFAVSEPDVVMAISAFGVNMGLMKDQISALSPAQPLSFNPQLLEAARRHTLDQSAGGFQSHVGSDGSNPFSRVAAAGYPWLSVGENVYGNARSVTHGHAAFEIDWGGGIGGMLTPPGHRLIIHDGNYREAGVAMASGFYRDVGPQVVTQVLATRANLTPFITGVVYYDRNTNGEYDPGEGLGGVQVIVSGARHYALTANSGGYSVPVPDNGNYTVTFSGPQLLPVSQSITVRDGLNVKLDWRPAYVPAVISGPALPATGQSARYSFTGVGGALGYEWMEGRRVAQLAQDGAESGTQQVSLTASEGYSVIQQSIRAAGGSAFRLAHPNPVDQSVTWRWQLRPGTNARLEWYNLLGWSNPVQVARVQVSSNSGFTWQDVWSQRGTGTTPQTSFERISVSLADFAGKEIELRFFYDNEGGSWFNQTSTGVGWYFDEVKVSGCEQLLDTKVRSTSTSAFNFTPTINATYGLRVRAVTAGGPLEWGPTLTVRAQ